MMRTYGRNADADGIVKRKADVHADGDDDGQRKRPRATPTPPSQPSSPTIAPRDLSQLFSNFDAPLPATTTSPTKLAKRMLGRSKTESSIGSNSPTTSPQRQTPSLSTVLSPSPTRSALPLTSSLSQSSIPKRSSITAKRTYAGNRSFLVKLPNDGSISLADELTPRESYSSLRERWGIDMSEDDPYHASSPTRSGTQSKDTTPSSSPSKAKPKAPKLTRPPMNPLKSITELRHKGETRRFMDEVGYLLEGMDKDASVGLRRTSALDIAKQLCDAEFSRKAKAADFIGQTWDAFVDCQVGNGIDTLLDIIFAFFACVVSSDTPSLDDIARRAKSPSISGPRGSPFAGALFSTLNNITPDKDPLLLLSKDAALRKLGVKRNDHILLKEAHTSIISASLFPVGIQLTTSLLATHALCALPPPVLSTIHFPVLLLSLRTHLQATIQVDFNTTHNLLRLLDTYLLGQWSLIKDDQSREALEDARDEWLLDGLVTFALACEKELVGGDADSVHRCFDMIFRVLVSLTHEDQMWCAALLKHESGALFVMRTIGRVNQARHDARSSGNTLVINSRGKGKAPVKAEEFESEAEQEDDNEAAQARLLDRLCLSLGLFTNLVQEEEEAKDVLRELVIDPTCKGCLSRCICPEPTSSLNILVQVYLHQLPSHAHPKVKSEPQPDRHLEDRESADTSFLLGHLAVLLGLLMKGNEENREVILDRLGGGHKRRELLDGLVDSAEELAAFYAVVSRKGERVEGGGEGAKGEGIARHVVTFLKELRDC